MRYFYIAPADSRYIEDAVITLSKWNDYMKKRENISIGILIRFANYKDKCEPCKLSERYGIPLFVDNGAFQFLSKKDMDSPGLNMTAIKKWLNSYYIWITKWHNYATAMALPDIPVHGRSFLPKPVREYRIKMTYTLHRNLVNRIRNTRDALAKMVVVLQGYELEEYIVSYKISKNSNVLGETCTFSGGCPYKGVFGVGSVCVRKPSSKGQTGLLAGGVSAGTLDSFLDRFLNYDWGGEVRGFHFFGLHSKSVVKFRRHPKFFASDTGAHGLNYKYKWKTRLKCKSINDRDCYIRAIEYQLCINFGREICRDVGVDWLWSTWPRELEFF